MSNEAFGRWKAASIVVALSETIRLMAEIGKVIDARGGWPEAFPGLCENKDGG